MHISWPCHRVQNLSCSHRTRSSFHAAGQIRPQLHPRHLQLHLHTHYMHYVLAEWAGKRRSAVRMYLYPRDARIDVYASRALNKSSFTQHYYQHLCIQKSPAPHRGLGTEEHGAGSVKREPKPTEDPKPTNTHQSELTKPNWKDIAAMARKCRLP